MVPRVVERAQRVGGGTRPRDHYETLDRGPGGGIWRASRSSPGVTTASIVAYRLYEEGLRAYYQQDLHGARRLFRAALADTIEVLGAQTIRGMHQRLHHHLRGLLLTARGRTAEAAEEFSRATFWPVAPSSGFTRTNLELGRALLALDRSAEAVRMLQPALRSGLEALDRSRDAGVLRGR